MDEISEYLLFTVIEGGHFGFRALQNSQKIEKQEFRFEFLTAMGQTRWWAIPLKP